MEYWVGIDNKIHNWVGIDNKIHNWVAIYKKGISRKMTISIKENWIFSNLVWSLYKRYWNGVSRIGKMKFQRSVKKKKSDELHHILCHQWLLTSERTNPIFSAGAHLAFLLTYNTVAFLQEDDDICIWMYEFTLYIFTAR